MQRWQLEGLIRRALAEDVGYGDLTTELLVPAGAVTVGIIHSKANGVLAGTGVIASVFQMIDPEIRVELHLAEGAVVEPGSLIATLRGPARGILTGERLALNLLQRLSGVATATRELVELIAGTKARLVDTRKTTPGLRYLEKEAVRAGGGYNHRIGLDDGILIKDNHIKLAGGIRRALERARRSAPHTLKIEIEVESLEQLQEAIAAQADLIMLDNMTPELMRQAVEIAGGRVLLEASGGITRSNIRRVAETGVDLISVGWITHSAPALDISLDIGEIKPGR